MIILTTAQSAVKLNISQRSVVRLIAENKLTPLLRLPSGDYILTEDEIARYLATRHIKTSARLTRKD